MKFNLNPKDMDGHNLTPDSLVKDTELVEREVYDESEKQAGVRRIEAVSKSWTKTSLIIAYVALLLIANITSLEIQVTSLMTPYATSAFKAHSLVSTIALVQNVVSAVIKPPMGKVADVFGRLEAFTITILLYTAGYIQQAASNKVKTFAAAQIFWAAGFNGLQVLQQIFVADTTDLLNRALYSTIFDIPFLWTVWAGPQIGNAILKRISWRWGYAVWAVVLPVFFVPLFVSLAMNQRRAKKLGFDVPSPFRGRSAAQVVRNLWFDLDLMGLLLLAAGISLVLLPLTLAPNVKGHWHNVSMIEMLVVGAVILVIVPFWEKSKKLAPKAFFPPELFKNRTVIAGCLIAFFYFMAFYLSIFPYFYSYLIIVQGKSAIAAGNITRVFSFASTLSSLLVSLLIKHTAHYKYYVTLGSSIYILGLALMLATRSPTASTASLIATQTALGIGGGFLNVPVQLAVQASASHQQVAAATTVWLTVLELGGAVGSAVSGAIWSTYVPRKLQLYLPAGTGWFEIYSDISVSGSYVLYPPGSEVREAINKAYFETMRYLLVAAVCAAAPILPLTFALRNYRLGGMRQPVEGLVIGKGGDGERERVGS